METTDAPQIIEHINQSVNFTPYESKWIPCSAKFVVMGIKPRGTGAINIYELVKGELKCIKEIEKPQGIKCGTFEASSLENRHLATGDYKGNLCIYDLENSEIPLYSQKAHGTIINAMDGCSGASVGCGAPEIATASRDGSVKIWDPRVNGAVVTLEPKKAEKMPDPWTVAFGNSYNDHERCVCAGYDNGDVKLYDLAMNKVRWETNVGNGVVNVQFDRKDIEMNKLVVTTLESKFRVYDMRTQHKTEGFTYLTEKAHKSTIWLARHLPQNRDIFMTCGGNGGLNIYKYSYPAQRQIKDAEGNFRGVMGNVELLNSRVYSTQPIVSFDWSNDKEGLACAAILDQTIRVFIVTKLNKY